MKKPLLLLLILLILALVTPAQSRTQQPSTPQPSVQISAAVKQFQAWLSAFNSGDRVTLRDYLQENRPSSLPHLNDELEFRQQTGGFEFKKIESSTPTTVKALLKERDSDQFARIELEVEADAPHRISKLGLQAVARPAEFAIPRLTQPDAVAALRTFLDKAAADDHFSGAAVVAESGLPIFAKAYGFADREKKIPNQLSTQFRLGSMNKMFTAVAIIQLVQAGKLNLTDTLSKFLPNYANKDLASKVTIQQMLTHTGGTGDFFGPEFVAHRLELRTLNDYVKLYENRPARFEPGSRWEYSNFGFLLLGVVIEKVAGQSYYDYVREHVFKPAGMLSTDSLPENETLANRSIGYTKEQPGGPWVPNTDTLPYRGTSAGGGYSTVEDLLRFANALEYHKLLDAEHTALLTSGKVDTPRGSKYSFGFMEIDEAGLHCFGHGGGAPGMNGDLKICPQSGYVIAVLSNLDPPAAERPANFIADRLPLQGTNP
jgi:CubicO group peptidase (beta-lactamase class C family)